MSDTPDISKIISVIMENPDLVKQIAALINNNQEIEPTQTVHTDSEQASLSVESASDTRQITAHRIRPERTQLLTAMKPYVRESRGKAIDTMVGILDILDVIGGR